MEKQKIDFTDRIDGHAAVVAGLPLGTSAGYVVPPSGVAALPRFAPSSDAGRGVRRTVRRRLLKAAAEGRRDNSVLASGAKLVLSLYEGDPARYAQYVPKGAADPRAFRRVLGCGSPLGSVTPAIRTHEHQHVVHGGLTHCGSPWVCPECAAKLQTRRAEEIRTALDWAAGMEKSVAMVTLTFTHSRADRLADNVELFTRATRRWLRSSTVRNVKAAAGYSGAIRSSEATYGRAHGWHWHSHTLWMTERPLAPYADRLRAAWLRALAAEGAFDMDDEAAVAAATAHAFALDPLDDLSTPEGQARTVRAVADYLVKQASQQDAKAAREAGMAAEVAMSGTKLGRRTSRTPFQILKDALMLDPERPEFDDLYFANAALFIEYALATKGRQQLVWSPGLKALVGVEEQSDEALLEESEETGEIVWGLTRQHWSALRGAGVLQEYLKDIAPAGTRASVQAYFDALFAERGLPPVLSAADTKVIWERERAARATAYARYRSGCDHLRLDVEEKEAIRSDERMRLSAGYRARMAAKAAERAAAVLPRRRDFEYQLSLFTLPAVE